MIFNNTISETVSEAVTERSNSMYGVKLVFPL
jgi:hypothetical protein